MLKRTHRTPTPSPTPRIPQSTLALMAMLASSLAPTGAEGPIGEAGLEDQDRDRVDHGRPGPAGA